MNPSIKIPLDYNVLRKAFANEIAKVTGLTAILEEPETTNSPRPTKPYMSFKISRPGDKSGDDSKQQIFDMTTSPPIHPKPTSDPLTTQLVVWLYSDSFEGRVSELPDL